MHDEKDEITIPWLFLCEDPKFLQCREGDLLRFAAREPAKEKQCQCMMRGTSHPTAHKARPQRFFCMEMGTHPTFHTVSLEKKEKRSAWLEGIFHPMCSPLG